MRLCSVIFILTATFYSLQLCAQKNIDDDDLQANPGDNIIKINLSAFVFKNISLQYERKLAGKFSVALNVKHTPFGKNLVGKAIQQFAGEESISLDQFRLGNTGIAPELRFYTGERGTFSGFYIGAFFSYNNYKTDLPIKYNSPVKTGVFSGNMKTYTFGLQLGAQWKMGKHGYLDWWAIGPNYGTESGDFIFTGELSGPEQNTLDEALNDLKDNLAVKIIDQYSVNNTGATMKTKGPWAGLRAMGFTIGYWF